MPHLSTLKMETVAFIHVKLQKCYNNLHYQISCFLLMNEASFLVLREQPKMMQFFLSYYLDKFYFAKWNKMQNTLNAERSLHALNFIFRAYQLPKRTLLCIGGMLFFIFNIYAHFVRKGRAGKNPPPRGQ